MNVRIASASASIRSMRYFTRSPIEMNATIRPPSTTGKWRNRRRVISARASSADWSMAQVGWGRADAAAIARISPLHAALFDLLDRSPYLAPRNAGVLARRMLDALFAPDQPRLTLLVGHDNNIAALASLLGTRFRVPGLGWNDPPPGGALGLALVRRADGHRFVRAFYIAATPRQVRRLTVLDADHRPAELSLPMGLCGAAARACPAAMVQRRLPALLSRTLAP